MAGALEKLAREVILGLIGGIKSRLIDPFRRPPFSTWVRFADPKISDYQRQQVASDLFDADERTLDESSLKIRKVSGSAEQLLADPFWLLFLFHAANKIPLSSALVECMFASFKQWIRCSPKPMGLPNLQGRQITVGFTSANARKQARLVKNIHEKKKKTKTPRPAWVLKKGTCALQVHGKCV